MNLASAPASDSSPDLTGFPSCVCFVPGESLEIDVGLWETMSRRGSKVKGSGKKGVDCKMYFLERGNGP